MQLNSITIMDRHCLWRRGAGRDSWQRRSSARGMSRSPAALLIILLSADFFLPMRQLGIVFPHCHERHGSKRKDLSPARSAGADRRARRPARTADIVCSRAAFFLRPRSGRSCMALDLVFPARFSFTSIVGASGCGKSTIASILMGRSQRLYRRSHGRRCAAVRIFPRTASCGTSPTSATRAICSRAPCAKICAWRRPDASDDELWAVLEQVKLAAFLRAGAGAGYTADRAGGATSPAASASGWHLPARCCMTRRCTSLMRLHRTLMSRAKTTSWRRSMRLPGARL